MILRLLNWQGITGIAVSLVLLIMLTVQKLEALRWQKESARIETLYRDEQAAFAVTVANARAAADTARAADRANADRVAAEQHTINERIADDLEARLAAARATADRLRLDAQGPANPGVGGGAPVPRLSPAAGNTPQGTREDRLPAADALTATEQAIQLDELIKWVRAQAAVDTNATAARSLPTD
jgi:hypothetical protein